MLNLPTTVINRMNPFAPPFQRQTGTDQGPSAAGWGTPVARPTAGDPSLAGGGVGWQRADDLTLYHQVLNRAVWSPLTLAKTLLGRVVAALTNPHEPLVFALDPTIERRWGRQISARGIDRDPVRSSDSHVVKTSGLRWLSLMLLTHIPFPSLPFPSLPFPSLPFPSRSAQRRRPNATISSAGAPPNRCWRAASRC